MSELPKRYDPHAVEKDIYRRWEEGGYFRPEVNPEGEPFTIIMPPPNASDPLHLGNAYFVIEDVFIRHARMRGRAALWLPGTDHAGFETQVVYERRLKEQGKSRFDFKREELYQQLWDYVQGNRQTVQGQLRQLGFSLDWSREKFTLDPDIVATVQDTFKRLYDDGLAYRGERIVNYCTHHGTSFSDLEVEHSERTDPLYTVRYRLKSSVSDNRSGDSNYIEVVTTRPETIPGDVAVAVHPDDERYRNLVGEWAIVPLGGREVPIIADTAVDPDFGTGAVKVTPAHDSLDFEIGERHHLPLVHVVGTDGRLKNAGELGGLTVEEGRAKAVELLGEAVVKTEEIVHSVGVCYKCGTVIEPLALEQWMIKTAPLAAAAVKAIEEGSIEFVPPRFEKTFFQWMERIRDWNISRQIVWGIPIPAWQCENDHWNVTVGEPPASCSVCGSTALERDPDVFDTWFSSGQWPFATLGYPDSEDFKKFYPTSVMETGYDILFFWVARMVMLGLYRTGQVPFRLVFLHGMLRNEGQKMSKSKGNMINPIEVSESLGTDALRATLLARATPGVDPSISDSELEGYRNFVNKLWNVARFALARTGQATEPTTADHWIAARLARATREVNCSLDRYRLDLALSQLYHFVWDDFADWYLEAAKTDFHQPTMRVTLETTLKLLHPFIPFVTEEIWSHLGQEQPLIITPWPETTDLPIDHSKAGQFERHINETRAERAASAVAEEKAGLEKYVDELKTRLENPGFKEKASSGAVQAAEQKLREAEARLRELE